MHAIEIISLILIACLCFLSTKSDLKSGLIRNKTLLYFAIFAILINCIYYGYFVRDLFIEYLLNFVVVSSVSLYLFFSHSFAGGDCKLVIVLAMLYPARFYLVYGNSNITLIFALGLAIFAGYCYLLFHSVWMIITRNVKITSQYLKDSIFTFVKSYMIATLYISLVNFALIVLGKFDILLNGWFITIACMFLAWCIEKFPMFKKKTLIVIVLIVVVFLSVFLRVIPFSINPRNYVLVLILLFCQMAIKTVIYEMIEITQLKKGMILSTMSTLLMQSSITKGLPSISTEDLRSRLTDTEVESVKIWAKATHTDSLMIVKKIPFAIFIAIGFVSYYIFWSVL